MQHPDRSYCIPQAPNLNITHVSIFYGASGRLPSVAGYLVAYNTAAGNERGLMATIGVLMAAMGTVREPALTTVTGLTVAVMALSAAMMAPTHNADAKSPT